MFAVVDIAGFQEKVTEGQKLKVPLLTGEGKVTFDHVLLTEDGSDIKVGAPYVAGAAVEAMILRHGKGDKIRIQKAHRRKRYRRVAGHRQRFTEIEVTKIVI